LVPTLDVTLVAPMFTFHKANELRFEMKPEFEVPVTLATTKKDTC
jgi:hypothetical protein